jgi:hypothetical protein
MNLELSSSAFAEGAEESGPARTMESYSLHS